jgi:hypothetical protein
MLLDAIHEFGRAPPRVHVDDVILWDLIVIKFIKNKHFILKVQQKTMGFEMSSVIMF